MKNWQDILVSPDTSILDTIRVIDSGSVQLAIVADAQRRILGTVTDGDIRRGILRGVSFEARVEEVMNPNPTTAGSHEIRASLLKIMKQRYLRQIPIVDEHGQIQRVETLDDILTTTSRTNPVVLMAGGLGTRLRPLTVDRPKPLLEIGNKPLLETILDNFISFGFQNFFISVNYKAEMITSYFGDGSRWGVNIRYLQETTRLGTAGCLRLLPEPPEEPLIVMNGDLLTKINLDQLLEFHRDHESTATVCVREYDFQVPYGVARLEEHRLVGIDEKPVQRFFVNAGIYVLDPSALRYLTAQTGGCDMPTLLQNVIDANQNVSAFPIREYWIDIGRIDDFERAQVDFEKVFALREEIIDSEN